ncbi:MAG: O-antigen ligase family protein [Verrucomicrobiae bacterium]|nr:O-antigen ligase family protein [Verrucomicrobiae bacterium]
MNHPSILRREYLFVSLALATLIPGAWMMGGYYSKAPYWMGIGGWVCGLVALYQVLRRPALWKTSVASHPVWLGWGVLVVWLLISLLNPTYRPVDLPTGSTYALGESVDWLPGVMSVQRSGPMILQLTGSMVLAWSFMALVRSGRRMRLFLWGLLINAFVLSLVGAWFKVTGAENILQVFQAVNPKFFASFTYHNHWVAFAGFHLMLGTGLACYYSFHPARQVTRGRGANRIVFLWVANFFLLLSLFLCESRTGLLFAAAYGFILVLYFMRRWLVARDKPVAWISWTLGFGLLALGWFSYQIVLPQLSRTTGRVEEAWYAIWDNESEVDNFRFNVGPRITTRLIARKPYLGWGWGSYPFAMSIYAPDYLDDQYAQFAHNDWLQFVAELGAVGCFLFVFPLVHMSIYFRPQNNLTRFTRVGMALLLAMAFFEGPFTNPVVLACVLCVLGLDLSISQQKAFLQASG